jgi:hypothetical protein
VNAAPVAVSKAIDPARVGLSKSLMTIVGDFRDWEDLIARAQFEGECLVWTGARNDVGYGQMSVAGKVVYVHRRAWEVARGGIPAGMYVCHHCDNPPCFLPAHLFLGTNSDNQRDAVAKGRKPRGEQHLGARLTDAQVEEIRATTGNQREIAKRYGVSQSLVSRLRSGSRRVGP